MLMSCCKKCEIIYYAGDSDAWLPDVFCSEACEDSYPAF